MLAVHVKCARAEVSSMETPRIISRDRGGRAAFGRGYRMLAHPSTPAEAHRVLPTRDGKADGVSVSARAGAVTTMSWDIARPRNSSTSASDAGSHIPTMLVAALSPGARALLFGD